LPHRDDALGIAVINTLDSLRVPLREMLKQRVSGVYDGIEGA
jgi:membrane protein